jgi:hypothetical protein
LTDAVEKCPAAVGVPIKEAFRACSWLGVAAWPANTTTGLPCATYPVDARTPSIGGPSRRSAIVFSFRTMAARWNSSRAPARPRGRIRSKPGWTFRCAKRISTFCAHFSIALKPSFDSIDPNATSTRRGPLHPACDGHFDLAPPPSLPDRAALSRRGSAWAFLGLQRGRSLSARP